MLPKISTNLLSPALNRGQTTMSGNAESIVAFLQALTYWHQSTNPLRKKKWLRHPLVLQTEGVSVMVQLLCSFSCHTE
jgi:hypothetical protein